MRRWEITAGRRALVRPFRVSHTVLSDIGTVTLTVTDGNLRGRGSVSVGPWTTDTTAQVAAAADRLVAAVSPRRLQLADLSEVIGGAAHTVAPAARMLAEMALLDLLGKGEDAPVWRLLEVPAPPPVLPLWETVPVGELPSGSMDRVKAKLGGAHDEDLLARLAALDVDVLVDVNRGWSAAEFTHRVAALRAVRLVAIEDPVCEVAALPVVRANLPDVPIILDEGVCSPSDAESAMCVADGVNVKLLKAGGLLAARELLRRVTEVGGTAMLGCFIEEPDSIAYAAQLSGHAVVHDLDGHLWLTGASAAEGLHLNRESPGNTTAGGPGERTGA